MGLSYRANRFSWKGTILLIPIAQMESDNDNDIYLPQMMKKVVSNFSNVVVESSATVSYSQDGVATSDQHFDSVGKCSKPVRKFDFFSIFLDIFYIFHFYGNIDSFNNRD